MVRLFSRVSTLFFYVTVFGQSPTNTPPASQVHISGNAIQCGKTIPGTLWVKFDGNPPLEGRRVKTDESGRYETDLPFGVWTMTTVAFPSDKTTFSRPRPFQVSASGRLEFNIYLRPPVACDVRGTPEGTAKVCWAEEFFRVPSADGVPYEVDLFNLHQYWTPCPTAERHREFATYNLLSIEADNVAYHPAETTLEASGDVLIQDESGEHKADSVTFKVVDGHATPMKRDRWR